MAAEPDPDDQQDGDEHGEQGAAGDAAAGDAGRGVHGGRKTRYCGAL
jgi:hypothetical protein